METKSNRGQKECDAVPEIALAEILKQNRWTISTAESCTGGRIGALLTKHPGSSVFYKGSVIAYCNEVKQSVLGVQSDILESQGAVSNVFYLMPCPSFFFYHLCTLYPF